jgi:predicted permease
MDYRALAYVITISLATAFLFGLLPALRCSRLDLNAVFRNRAGGALGPRRGRRSFRFLLTAQALLAVVLLAGAGAMVHSFWNVYAADVGAKIGNIRTLGLHLPEDKYPDRAARAAFSDRLVSRLQSLPGVESISIGIPPAGGTPGRHPYELRGDEPSAEQSRATAGLVAIGPDYFRTLGALVRGREFDRLDGTSRAPVAIVNQRFAKEHWPGQDSLGQQIRLLDPRTPEPWRTVVGVTSDIVYDQGRQEISPVIYVPYAQWETGADLPVMVRTMLPAARLAALFQHEIGALDPNLPIWQGPYNLTERLAAGGLYGNIRNHSIMLLIFGGVALLLSSVGLYAVIAHSVSQRTQEIGIRIAVGARSRDIFKLVLDLAMLPFAAGLVLGVGGSLAVTRVLESELVRVSPADPLSLAAGCAVLAAAAALACSIPAWRAMRLDPAIALKRD